MGFSVTRETVLALSVLTRSEKLNQGQKTKVSEAGLPSGSEGESCWMPVFVSLTLLMVQFEQLPYSSAAMTDCLFKL